MRLLIKFPTPLTRFSFRQFCSSWPRSGSRISWAGTWPPTPPSGAPSPRPWSTASSPGWPASSGARSSSSGTWGSRWVLITELDLHSIELRKWACCEALKCTTERLRRKMRHAPSYFYFPIENQFQKINIAGIRQWPVERCGLCDQFSVCSNHRAQNKSILWRKLPSMKIKFIPLSPALSRPRWKLEQTTWDQIQYPTDINVALPLAAGRFTFKTPHTISDLTRLYSDI